MLLVSVIAALISARLAGLVPASVSTEHAINVTGLMAFPLAVVYTRQATGAASAIGSLAVLWVPAAAYLAALGVRAGLGVETRVPFSWLLPIAVTFTATSAFVLWRRRVPAPTALVPPAWVVGFMALMNVAQVVRMSYGHVPAIRALVPLVCAGGFVVMVAFVAWRIAGARMAAEPAGAPRYERSSLDEETALDLLGRIDHALSAGRLFARADLTLGLLADAVGSTPHQVSEALNRFRGQAFHERVSRLRVDDVKAQLADPANDRYTIEGIGASAGFGSRSSLYAAFQRLEGQTPTACRAAARASTRVTPDPE
jgi:AraC-like DNA-binding protein